MKNDELHYNIMKLLKKVPRLNVTDMSTLTPFARKI